MKKPNLHNWQDVLAILYTILAFTFIITLFADHAYDDPFITYRYAHNLAHGFGFVYNPGERILSTTTPFFTILLASLTWMIGEAFSLPLIANILGALSLAIGGLLIWKLAKVWHSPWVGWAGLLLYPIFPLTVITLGSETPLYITLCLGTLLLYTRRRYPAAACLAALAVLTRPDGILIAFVLGAHYLLFIRKRIPILPVLVFLLITSVWVLFAWEYFGSIIPVTLAAKQSQVNIATSESFVPGLFSIMKWYDQPPYWLALLVACLGLITYLWRERSWLLLISWTVIYFLGYSLLGVSRYFWYYAPLVPGFIVLLGLGITATFHLLSSITTKYSSKLSLLSTLLPGLLLLLFIASFGISLFEYSQLPNTRATLYRDTGEWLAANTSPATAVGTLETGIIGYYSQRRMIDFAGLLYPEVASSMTIGSTYEDSAQYVIERYRPEVLVIHQNMLPSLLSTIEEHNCLLLTTFQATDVGNSLVIYACQ